MPISLKRLQIRNRIGRIAVGHHTTAPMDLDYDWWDPADDDPDPDQEPSDWYDHPSLTAEERNPSLCR